MLGGVSKLPGRRVEGKIKKDLLKRKRKRRRLPDLASNTNIALEAPRPANRALSSPQKPITTSPRTSGSSGRESQTARHSGRREGSRRHSP